jgi:imidazoleglycerol phosphate dehydratase HisB
MVIFYTASKRRTKDSDLLSSNEHHSIEEPAILLGGAFMTDVV